MNKLVIFALLVTLFAVASAAPSQTQAPTTAKVPLGCPPIANGGFAITIFQCFEDSDCQDPEAICCPNGVGRYCFNVITGKMSH